MHSIVHPNLSDGTNWCKHPVLCNTCVNVGQGMQWKLKCCSHTWLSASKAVHESICRSSGAIRNESDSDLHPTDPGQIRSDSWMTHEIHHFSKSQQQWPVVVAFFNLNEFPTIFVDQKTKNTITTGCCCCNFNNDGSHGSSVSQTWFDPDLWGANQVRLGLAFYGWMVWVIHKEPDSWTALFDSG